MSNLVCPNCGSNDVQIQAVAVQKKKHHGLIYWLCFGWFIDMLLWIFLTLPRLIIAIFKPKRTKTVIQSNAVCQSCGKTWKVS